MAEQYVYIGGAGPYIFDDIEPLDIEGGDDTPANLTPTAAINTSGVVKAEGEPAEDWDLVRLGDTKGTQAGTRGYLGALNQTYEEGLLPTSAVLVDYIAFKFESDFTDGDLIDGVLNVNHLLNNVHPLVWVYNNENKMTVVEVTIVDSNHLDIDLSSWQGIEGTWHVTAIG